MKAITCYRCLRADVSYFLSFPFFFPFPRATKEIGDFCTQANVIDTFG